MKACILANSQKVWVWQGTMYAQIQISAKCRVSILSQDDDEGEHVGEDLQDLDGDAQPLLGSLRADEKKNYYEINV